MTSRHPLPDVLPIVRSPRGPAMGDEECGGEAGKKNEEKKSSDSQQHGEFDWLNWMYWSIWWQQYSYWAWSQQQQIPSPPQTSETTQSASSEHQAHQYPYYYNQWYTNYQGQTNQGNVGVPQRPQLSGNILTLQIRIINGFETYIAAPWKRMFAEIIDIFLFALLLKAYFPEIDLRIPEILLEGSDVWATIEQEENLDEIQTILQTFVFSLLMQRMNHVLLEFLWTAVFSCTPGKWLLGLRVVHGQSIHLTRTQPGFTIRVVPGGRISPLRALVRAMFKAVFSLFCPLVIFFFALYRGQTKYDRLLHCAVIDSRSLYRPVNTGSHNPAHNQQPQLLQVG